MSSDDDFCPPSPKRTRCPRPSTLSSSHCLPASVSSSSTSSRSFSWPEVEPGQILVHSKWEGSDFILQMEEQHEIQVKFVLVVLSHSFFKSLRLSMFQSFFLVIFPWSTFKPAPTLYYSLWQNPIMSAPQPRRSSRRLRSYSVTRSTAKPLLFVNELRLVLKLLYGQNPFTREIIAGVRFQIHPPIRLLFLVPNFNLQVAAPEFLDVEEFCIIELNLALVPISDLTHLPQLLAQFVKAQPKQNPFKFGLKNQVHYMYCFARVFKLLLVRLTPLVSHFKCGTRLLH